MKHSVFSVCRIFVLASILVVIHRVPAAEVASDANRFTYLDDACDPYSFGLHSAKLITPQWVGETGVDAVVTLGIDDMRDPKVYERYLRPILERLKQIDGRAPVSIMTNAVNPQDPQLQVWLKEGLSIETHTADHPCPCLQTSGFDAAKSTYDRCVDAMSAVAGSKPVAFRFPCCDSQNTPSPRAFAEIMAKTTPAGNFLQIDTSVCAILDDNDEQLPQSLVRDSQGRQRFAKYAPFKNFVNKVFNYPYPFVVAGSIWEFPIATPDDWQGFHLQQPFNPETVKDMQAYVDAIVLKRGVANYVFHPHNWIRNDQMTALVEYADKQYGKRIRFLTFKECLDRLNQHLLAGQPVRAEDGGDNGVRVVDVNDDGFMDVLIGNDAMQRTRLWDPATEKWIEGELPVKFVTGTGKARRSNQVRFGVLPSAARADGSTVMFVSDEVQTAAWRFAEGKWVVDERLLVGLEVDGKKIIAGTEGRDLGVRFRDIDVDGSCELLISNPKSSAAFRWDSVKQSWQRLPFALPNDVWIANANGLDGGTRFADVDADGLTDLIASSERGTRVLLFDSMQNGWTRSLLSVESGEPDALPMFARDGMNGGGWIAERQLWFQNEDTAKLTDGVFHRSFNELLKDTESRPLSPDAALESLHVAPGYRVELVAAEPLVMDPVAFDWGPDGKLWVVEMADYPLGVDGKGTAGGRVRFLEDTDNDGRYDKSTVFLDGVSYPNGVLAWRDGVLVTAAPEMFFARDTNGDGKCDERTAIYEGFNPGNQQHRANGLRWSMDGWVHLANGDSGGTIRSVKTGEKVDISSRDVRVKPDQGTLETVTGQTQFGRDRDDWGHWFGCNNPNPLYQFVLDDRYLRRNPHVAPPAAFVQVVDRSQKLFPLSRTVARFNEFGSANMFTSACSAMIYRDDLLPGLEGNAIACEPVHNLVHREVLSRNGLLFTAKRAIGEEESHLLRSTDNWFRPVMTRTGPDGAVWIADMYRQTIEHPEWIPDDWEAKLDLRAGYDKGRIYRIVPIDGRLRSLPRLDRLTTKELVAQLDSPNGTMRDRVQQQLLQRGDRASRNPLTKMARHAKMPMVRAQSLWTLAGLELLDEATLLSALADPDVRVQTQAVLIVEPLLNKTPLLGDALLKLVDNPDSDLQLQLAYTLGEWIDPRAVASLGTLALRHAADPYLCAAVLSSIDKKIAPDVLARVLSSPMPSRSMVEHLLAIAASGDNRQALAATLKRICTPGPKGFVDWQFAAMATMFAELRTRGMPIDKILDQDESKILEPIVAAARAGLANNAIDIKTPASAMQLIVEVGNADDDFVLLGELLTPRQPVETQSAVINAIARSSDVRAAKILLAGWDAYSPAIRGQAIDALIDREAWATLLLDQMETGTILASQIDAARRQRLLQSNSSAVQERARKHFATETGSRQDVINRYQSVLALAGDRAHGREVFLKRCATCHVLEGKGTHVGADLSALSNRTAAAQLIAILDPNRAIEEKFMTYVAALDDGRQFSGILASESGESLTLRAQEGKEQVILRKDLEALKNTGKSLMPEGLEKDLSEQDLADVIAYVGGFGPLPKQFPGNEPRTVHANDQEELILKATACRISGPTIIFESKYQNLGYWGSADDQASWSLKVPRAGKYEVVLDYACQNESAGNPYRLELLGQKLEGTIVGTGSWDDYRKITLGHLELPAGDGTLTFRSASPLPANKSLLDLRTVTLKPSE